MPHDHRQRCFQECWRDDERFPRIRARMMLPLNLATVVPRKDYVTAWMDRVNQRHPGQCLGNIGEYMDGKWWGLFESTLIGGMNAYQLLSPHGGKTRAIPSSAGAVGTLTGSSAEDKARGTLTSSHKWDHYPTYVDTETRRLFRQDDSLEERNVHHWQQQPPEGTNHDVSQSYLSRGPLFSTVRYDPDKRRSGLPEDVAALVQKIDKDSATVQLVICIPPRPGRYGFTFGEHHWREPSRPFHRFHK